MTTTNAEQAAAWNGDSGRRWAENADRRDAVLAPVGDLLAATAALRPGERVLDIGCGCGATTLAAAEAVGPTGAVVGVDLSAAMLEVARARAEGRAGVELRQADAQTASLDGSFDVAISRFGTMFFADPTAAFANLARHLSSGGRICIATWQPLDANPWLEVAAAALRGFTADPAELEPLAPAMFAQSEPSTIHSLLAGAGFTGIQVEPRTVPFDLGASVAEAAAYLADTGPARALLEAIPSGRHEDALGAVADALRPHLEPGHGVRLDGAVLVSTARS